MLRVWRMIPHWDLVQELIRDHCHLRLACIVREIAIVKGLPEARRWLAEAKSRYGSEASWPEFEMNAIAAIADGAAYIESRRQL